MTPLFPLRQLKNYSIFYSASYYSLLTTLFIVRCYVRWVFGRLHSLPFIPVAVAFDACSMFRYSAASVLLAYLTYSDVYSNGQRVLVLPFGITLSVVVRYWYSQSIQFHSIHYSVLSSNVHFGKLLMHSFIHSLHCCLVHSIVVRHSFIRWKRHSFDLLSLIPAFHYIVTSFTIFCCLFSTSLGVACKWYSSSMCWNDIYYHLFGKCQWHSLKKNSIHSHLKSDIVDHYSTLLLFDVDLFCYSFILGKIPIYPPFVDSIHCSHLFVIIHSFIPLISFIDILLPTFHCGVDRYRHCYFIYSIPLERASHSLFSNIPIFYYCCSLHCCSSVILFICIHSFSIGKISFSTEITLSVSDIKLHSIIHSMIPVDILLIKMEGSILLHSFLFNANHCLSVFEEMTIPLFVKNIYSVFIRSVDILPMFSPFSVSLLYCRCSDIRCISTFRYLLLFSCSTLRSRAFHWALPTFRVFHCCYSVYRCSLFSISVHSSSFDIVHSFICWYSDIIHYSLTWYSYGWRAILIRHFNGHSIPIHFDVVPLTCRSAERHFIHCCCWYDIVVLYSFRTSIYCLLFILGLHCCCSEKLHSICYSMTFVPDLFFGDVSAFGVSLTFIVVLLFILLFITCWRHLFRAFHSVVLLTLKNTEKYSDDIQCRLFICWRVVEIIRYDVHSCISGKLFIRYSFIRKNAIFDPFHLFSFDTILVQYSFIAFHSTEKFVCCIQTLLSFLDAICCCCWCWKNYHSYIHYSLHSFHSHWHFEKTMRAVLLFSSIRFLPFIPCDIHSTLLLIIHSPFLMVILFDPSILLPFLTFHSAIQICFKRTSDIGIRHSFDKSTVVHFDDALCCSHSFIHGDHSEHLFVDDTHCSFVICCYSLLLFDIDIHWPTSLFYRYAPSFWCRQSDYWYWRPSLLLKWAFHSCCSFVIHSSSFIPLLPSSGKGISRYVIHSFYSLTFCTLLFWVPFVHSSPVACVRYSVLPRCIPIFVLRVCTFLLRS